MPIIRQGSLFDLQELYDLEPTRRFEAVFFRDRYQPNPRCVKEGIAFWQAC